MSELRTEETMREESQDDRGPASRLGIAALARDATIYGGTRVLLKSLAFLLVPLYAAFLSPTEFGILELVIATIAVVDVLIAANMDGVFMRFYFDRDESAWRRQIISTYLVIETIYPAVVVGTLIGFSGVISDRIFGTSAYSAFFVIALIDVYLTNVVDLPMMLCRVRRKPYTFAAYSLARGLVQIVASVLLVAVFEVGVKGILIASLCSVCFAFLITLREYVRDLTRVTEWRLAREMVSFAWPGIIGGLSFYALNLMDRFFVKHYHGLADSGLYGAAFRYSQVVLVAVLAFRLGWTSWHYGWLNSGRHEQMVARGANYYFFATGFLAVLVSAWILPVFHVAMPTRYWDATPAVAPLALAAVATGAYNIFAVGFNVKKRMRLVPLLAVGGALVAVGLYFVLIPPYSFQGAAWATAASFAVLALATALVAHRIYPVPWDRYRILLAATAALSLCLASLIVDDSVSIGMSIPLRLAITAAFPLLLFAFRFFPPGDLAAARARVRRLAPG